MVTRWCTRLVAGSHSTAGLTSGSKVYGTVSGKSAEFIFENLPDIILKVREKKR
jgi:hypothetical protein